MVVTAGGAAQLLQVVPLSPPIVTGGATDYVLGDAMSYRPTRLQGARTGLPEFQGARTRLGALRPDSLGIITVTVVAAGEAAQL